MKQVKFGKVVNTHGIRGELKLSSNSDFKEERLKKGNTIIINNTQYIVNSWRVHKNHDLITLNNFTNINDVEFLKGEDVYVDLIDETINTKDHINNIIGLPCYNQNDNLIGKVTSILDYPMYQILEIKPENGKKILVPFIEQFIITHEQEKLKLNILKGMDENEN